MPLSPQEFEHHAELIVGGLAGRLAAAPESLAAADIAGLGTFLKESETKLIQLMSGEQPSEHEPGEIEFGLVLYWLHTRYPLLASLLHLPPTSITPQMLQQWNQILWGPGVVYYDGTLIGYNLWETMDLGWLLAALYDIALRADLFQKAPFGIKPATLSLAGSPSVTLALTGDWGTGQWTDGNLTCPSMSVLQQIRKLNPDVTIHLGDVYYAGTESGVFGLPGEETLHLVNLWAAGSKGTFTLNSNHEMYDGGRGYFGKALSAHVFGGQQGTSYFAIDGGAWILVGLDSAYYDPSLFFMNGAIVDANQIGFLQGLDTANKKVIVLTHHNPLSVDGTQKLSLWGNVEQALGRAPDVWYWGHIHNGIVYSPSSAAGSTLARCVGHGALPFGVAYGLKNQSSVTWFADKLLSSQYPNTTPQQANRVLNGFALLTLTQTSLKEEIYDQAGNVAWSQTTQL